MIEKSIWISVGAMLGANARYWLGVWVAAIISSHLPFATFLINVTGSFLLGLVAGLTQRQPNPSLTLFFAVGFCGSYTTFSTFSLEILNLWSTGNQPLAVSYALASVFLGVAGAWLGMTLTT